MAENQDIDNVSQENVQNNENTIRNAANVAMATGHPAVGMAIKAADRITGWKSTNKLAKKMNMANKISPHGRRTQRLSNSLSDSGLGNNIDDVESTKNGENDSNRKEANSGSKTDLKDAFFRKNNRNKEKGTTEVNDDEKSSLIGKIPLRIKLIIAAVALAIVFIIIFISVVFSAVGSVLEWFDISKNSDVYTYNDSSVSAIKFACNDGIMVDNQVYDLEEYVAGVVTAEAASNQNIEALKALAIAARTYAIVKTDNCKNSISNSEDDQLFTSSASDDAKTATAATEGLILTYDSKIFLSEYDSFYKGGDYNCGSDGSCSVTYTKLPNNEEHIVTISASYTDLISGGEGRGMSKVASYELADSGKDYEEILKYFYSSDITIVDFNKISGYNEGISGESDGFSKRTTVPVQGNAHDDIFYYSSNNISFASGFTGECTWYAYGRANEILDSVGSSLKWSYASHAKGWYSYNLGLGSKGFSSSSNVNNPKVGAIIVWTSSKYGHVAIVEAVNDDGTIDYSESNVTSAKSSSNKYGFRYQSHISYKNSGVGTISRIWDDYSFDGYIYMIE